MFGGGGGPTVDLDRLVDETTGGGHIVGGGPIMVGL